MHNSSYLGGSLTIVVAWAFQIVARLKGNNESPQQTS